MRFVLAVLHHPSSAGPSLASVDRDECPKALSLTVALQRSYYAFYLFEVFISKC